ncbi:MAG: hypothetical protein WAT20_05655 [Ferruginibacter sp.]|nr:hypothetical protein [Chitinophagaceae bacterium]
MALWLIPGQHAETVCYICYMIAGYSYLSKELRSNAIQRLTALWAFTESGLGGIMHALQIPFTGLLVGGMAVIMISLIAEISDHNFKQVLKSAVIVLLVKAMVSPHTPFPAYIAVSFQAVLGYTLFSLLKVNFFSIALLSTMAMLESAIQKLLIITLFFGKSLWVAMDDMVAYIGKQFGNTVANGSYWIVGIYLLIYLAGGVFIAMLAYRTIKSFKSESPSFLPNSTTEVSIDFVQPKKYSKKNSFKKLWILILLMIGLSAVLFVFADDNKKGWLAVAKTITWTLSAILIWFMLISPLFTKAIQKLLKKKQSRYSEEVLNILSFLPVLKQLTAQAWQQSKLHHGFSRWQFFFTSLIHTTLTYTESASTQMPLNNPV